MASIFDIFKKHELEREREQDPIPQEDLFKLLSIYYTFNHGDRPCQPVEFQYHTWSKEIGGFDFATLTKKFQKVGYYIDRVVCVTDEPLSEEFVPFVPDEKEYEKRRKNNDYLPVDISYIIVSNLSGAQYIIEESIDSIEFLARGGDERAIKTINTWNKFKADIKAHYSFCPPQEEEKGKAKVKKRN